MWLYKIHFDADMDPDLYFNADSVPDLVRFEAYLDPDHQS
jgi:hypothetical protein